MDFLLFYSKRSAHCAALLEEVPLLNEKAICIDSQECRAALDNLPYKVRRVPTLLIVDGVSQIIKVIEGAAEIKNWFILTTYSMSSSAAIQPIEPEEVDELLPPGQLPEATPLEDIHRPSEEYTLKSERTDGVKSLAEELQRQRDSFIERTGPNEMAPGAAPRR